MKSKLILIFFILPGLILVTASNSMAKKNIPQSIWTKNPLKIDGSSSDWTDVQINKVKKYSIDYAFKNNSNYLYIIFTFKESKFLSSINSSGMTIWLNNKGKKKKRYGIKFLKRRITPEAFIQLVEKKHGKLAEDKKAEIKKRKFYTINQSGIVNKESENPIPINLAAEQAPAFQVKPAAGMMSYEFKIPLQNIEGKITGIGTSPGEKIALGFEWGGLTKELREAYSRQRGYTSSSSAKGGVSSSIPGSGEMEGTSTGNMGTRGARSPSMI